MPAWVGARRDSRTSGRAENKDRGCNESEYTRGDANGDLGLVDFGHFGDDVQTSGGEGDVFVRGQPTDAHRAWGGGDGPAVIARVGGAKLMPADQGSDGDEGADGDEEAGVAAAVVQAEGADGGLRGEVGDAAGGEH